MNEEIAGKLTAFKGEDEYIPSTNVLVEVTDLTNTGDMELAFNAPTPGTPRIYLRISLPEIIQGALSIHMPKR